MKVIVDNADPGYMTALENRLLSENFTYRLNLLLQERGLTQYQLSNSYLESNRDDMLKQYEENSRVVVTDDYYAMKEGASTEQDWWIYTYFCCAFILWFLPFILCAMLLSEVHTLRADMDALHHKFHASGLSSIRPLSD